MHQSPASGGQVVACGRTDITKLISLLHFANAPENQVAAGRDSALVVKTAALHAVTHSCLSAAHHAVTHSCLSAALHAVTHSCLTAALHAVTHSCTNCCAVCSVRQRSYAVCWHRTVRHEPCRTVCMYMVLKNNTVQSQLYLGIFYSLVCDMFRL